MLLTLILFWNRVNDCNTVWYILRERYIWIFSLYFAGAVGGEGGDEDDKEKEEEAERERQEAIREAEERRKEKHRKMEEEREKMRQEIRDKVSNNDFATFSVKKNFQIALEISSIFVSS